MRLLRWWRNRAKPPYTPVKLVRHESIGVDEGYFACQSEWHQIKMQWYADIKVMPGGEASVLLNNRCADLTRKYFGPKYVRA